MPPFDALGIAALEQEVVRPAFFALIDVQGDVMRVTTAGYNVTFTGTGDPDLDGQTFSAVDPDVVEIGEVTHREGGSETLTLGLSGILELDADTLNNIGDRTKWQGRTLRLWMLVRDATGAAQGGVVPYYTGYMAAAEVVPSPEEQIIRMAVENYLSALTARASNRGYLNQSEYDAADQSARATIGSANGSNTGPGAGIGGGGSGGGGSYGGGGGGRADAMIEPIRNL